MVNDLEKEASYKIEPYIHNGEDFELHDISDLIDQFKVETSKTNGGMTDVDSKDSGGNHGQ